MSISFPAPPWFLPLIAAINENIAFRHQKWLATMLPLRAAQLIILDDAAWDRIRQDLIASLINYAASLIDQAQSKPAPEYWQALSELTANIAVTTQDQAEDAANIARRVADNAALRSADAIFGLADASRKLGWAIYHANDGRPAGPAEAVDMAAQAVDTVIYTQRAAHLPLRHAQRSALSARKDVWAMAARRLFQLLDNEISTTKP